VPEALAQSSLGGITYIMETPTPRVKRLLTPIHNEDGTILVQETPKSVVYDHWPDGFDYACPHCRDHILVVNVRNDQIWDVTFKCFACGKMSTAPTLPPGMAFPARHIEFLQGWYSLRESVDLKRATVAGHAAGERRRREAGEKGVTFGDTKTLENREADAEFLTKLLDRVKSLMGDNFNRLRLSDQRGLASKTPPPKRHSLMVAVERLPNAIETSHTNTPSIEITSLIELGGTITPVRPVETPPAVPRYYSSP
jgi:hypothetical protein